MSRSLDNGVAGVRLRLLGDKPIVLHFILLHRRIDDSLDRASHRQEVLIAICVYLSART